MISTSNNFGQYYRLFPPTSQNYNLVVVTPPAVEPVTFSDLAAQLRLDTTDDSAYVQQLGMVGREFIEQICNITVIATTFDVSFDYWGNPFRGLRLPKRPASSVVSVSYVDSNGTTQTLDSSKFDIRKTATYWYILPKWGTIFPITGFVPNAVTVRFTAGYADANSTPAMVKAAILQWSAWAYENREAVAEGNPKPLPYAFESILRFLRAPEVH